MSNSSIGYVPCIKKTKETAALAANAEETKLATLPVLNDAVATVGSPPEMMAKPVAALTALNWLTNLAPLTPDITLVFSVALDITALVTVTENVTVAARRATVDVVVTPFLKLKVPLLGVQKLVEINLL